MGTEIARGTILFCPKLREHMAEVIEKEGKMQFYKAHTHTHTHTHIARNW